MMLELKWVFFQIPSAMHAILNNLLIRLWRHNTSINFGTVNLVKRRGDR